MPFAGGRISDFARTEFPDLIPDPTDEEFQVTFDPSTADPNYGFTTPFVGTDPPLNKKEWEGAKLAAEWINEPDTPKQGEDGRLLYLYGVSMPSVKAFPENQYTLIGG